MKSYFDKLSNEIETEELKIEPKYHYRNYIIQNYRKIEVKDALKKMKTRKAT